jgi:hypothetical protein
MTVLEKLKQSKEQLDSLDCRNHETYKSFLAVQLKANWRIYKVLQRLIETLELVEAKATIVHSSEKKDVGAYMAGHNDGELELARELLAVVNGETKGE